MVRTVLRAAAVVAGIIGVLSVVLLGLSHARAQVQAESRGSAGDGSFTIFDTPQATLLLDQKSGNLWRIGYTEVAGQRFWFGTYVPREPPTSFKEFQNRLRKEIRTAPRER